MSTFSQLYGTVINKPIGVIGKSIDLRSQYYDTTSFSFRDYASTAEALTWLSDPDAATQALIRTGGFPIYVKINGIRSEYWFKDDLTTLVLKVSSPHDITFNVNKRYNVEDFGMLTTNTAAQNKTALQSAITYLNTNGGGVLQMTGAYPCDGPIAPANNVKIEGISWSDFKGPSSRDGTTRGSGGPANACFSITDTVNSLFSGGSSVGFSLRNIGFNYPNQPIGTTDVSTLIQYPTTLSFGQYTYNVTLENLWFVGTWKQIEFTAECADLFINKVYGYPLSGLGIDIHHCKDIPRIVDCMWSPSVGNNFRPLPAGPLFTVHSVEVANYVMNSGNAFITLDDCDEFQIRGCFAYTYPVFIRITNSYGTIFQSNCDVGRKPMYLSCGTDVTKNITVMGGSYIGSGGDNLADRNIVEIAGDGYYKFFGLTPKLGTTPFSGLQTAGVNNNAVIKINNVGVPHVSVFNLSGTVYTGTYMHDIQNLNPNAVIKVQDVDIPNAVNKYIPGAFPLVIYDANMLGTAATAFSAYTAEVGAATSALATATLDGNGGLQFNTSTPSQIVLPGTGLSNFRVSVLIKSLPTGGGALSIQISRTADSTGYLAVSVGNIDGARVNHNIQNEAGVVAITNSYNATFPLILNASVINGIVYTSINDGDILSATLDRLVIDPRVTSQSGLVDKIIMDKLTYEVPKIAATEQVFTSGSFIKIRSSQTDIWAKIDPISVLSAQTIEFPDNPYPGQLLDLTFGNTIRFGTVVSNLTLQAPAGYSIKQPLADKVGMAGVNLTWRFDGVGKAWVKLGTPIELGTITETLTPSFIANMNGSSGVNFNSYTPDIGNATATGNAATLTGAGTLQFNTTAPGSTISVDGTIPANRRVAIIINSIPTGGGGYVQVYMRRSTDSTKYTVATISNFNGTIGVHNIQDQSGVIINHPAIAISFPLLFTIDMIDGTLTSKVNGDSISVAPDATQTVDTVTIISVSGVVDSISVNGVATTLGGFVTAKDIEITDNTQSLIQADTATGTRYRIVVTNGAIALVNIALASVFFLDDFIGSAGAYSSHTPDKGTATPTGTISLDGSGNVNFTVANSNISVNGSIPANRRLTAIGTSIPNLQNFSIGVKSDGTGNYLITAFQVTGTGVGTLSIVTNAGNQAVLAGISFSGDITMVTTSVGNLISTSINGGTALTYTTSITGEIASLAASSTATFRSFKVEPL